MLKATGRSRRLGIALREHRNRVGWNLDRTAAEIGVSKSTMHRLETGKATIRPAIVRALLITWEVDKDEIEELVELAREAKQSGWWEAYANDVPTRLSDLMALESEALVINIYNDGLMPGLVQTSDYARAVVRSGGDVLNEAQINARIEARLERQKRLVGGDPPIVCLIIDEAVLLRPVGGPEVMHDQISKILELSKRDNFTVQIMPLLEYEDPSETIASVDTVAGNVIIDGTERLQICVRSFAKMRSIALGPTASRTRLKVALASYEERICERTPGVEEEQQEQPGRRMRRGD
jgi:DNA-binding XRE family transcriptional regulator